MPRDLKQKLEKLKHPFSRKTISLTKRLQKNEKKDHNKLGTHIKQNILGEKVLWFKERIPEDCAALTKEQVLQLIETYLSRFDEELQQIALKNSIGQRKNRQHASREDIINITKKRDVDEFATCGVEMPDLTDPRTVKALREWSGELRYLHNFKLKRVARKHLT